MDGVGTSGWRIVAAVVVLVATAGCRDGGSRVDRRDPAPPLCAAIRDYEQATLAASPFRGVGPVPAEEASTYQRLYEVVETSPFRAELTEYLNRVVQARAEATRWSEPAISAAPAFAQRCKAAGITLPPGPTVGKGPAVVSGRSAEGLTVSGRVGPTRVKVGELVVVEAEAVGPDDGPPMINVMFGDAGDRVHQGITDCGYGPPLPPGQVTTTTLPAPGPTIRRTSIWRYPHAGTFTVRLQAEQGTCHGPRKAEATAVVTVR
jgi:hypothetical protein